jgi:hypothetical protein
MDVSGIRVLSIVVLILALVVSAGFAEASASWPNEPPGATQILDFSFNTMQGNGLMFYGGDASLISDPTAPGSPDSVVQYRYAAGFPGGIAPAKHYTSLGNKKELFIGYWWKPSSPWQGHAAGNKVTFLISPVFGNLITFMSGPPNGPFTSSMYIAFPTSNGHLLNSYGDDPGSRFIFGNGVGIKLGQWHRVELYVKHSTTPTSRDGIIRWWINGQLAGNYTTVNFMPEPWVEFQLDPTWGGMGYTKDATDYFWFDHVHISSPSGGSVSNDMPPGPPSAPRILNVTVQ